MRLRQRRMGAVRVAGMGGADVNGGRSFRGAVVRAFCFQCSVVRSQFVASGRSGYRGEHGVEADEGDVRGDGKAEEGVGGEGEGEGAAKGRVERVASDGGEGEEGEDEAGED